MHGDAVTGVVMPGFRVLGPLEVHLGDRRIGPLPRRQRALLTRLLQDFGRPVAFDALADAVWHGEPAPADVKGALYTVVSRLRASLGDTSFIAKHHLGYQMKAGQSDHVTFTLRLDEARGLAVRDPVAALEVYAEALACWRGAAFAEFADTFARPAAVALEETRFAAQLEWIGLLGEAGQPEPAALAAERLVLANPWRETAWVLWMRLLAGAGRQAEALEVFQRLRSYLGEQLGASPGQEAADLHVRILRGEAGRAPAPRPRYFPQPLGSFVGRAQELKVITEAVCDHRVITLVGPGGIGKTRLAVEFALSTLDMAATYWIDLAAVFDAPSVPYAIADALGVTHAERADLADVLATALGQRRVTLLLDNCEHLLDAVAEWTVPLAHRCPGLTVLATSREALRVEGERVIRVGPLPLRLTSGQPGSDAAQLLRQRLVAAIGAEEPVEALPEHVIDDLCRRLDGMPLALELAAARAATLGLASLAQSMPAGPPERGRPDRHRDLDALFAWSYDLLTASEQSLLRLLAVFPGWFSLSQLTALATPTSPLPAAENMPCSPGEAAAAGQTGVLAAAENVPWSPSAAAAVQSELAALVGKSFVVPRFGPVGGQDYRLLVPVREFAARRLAESGEEHEVWQRHARLAVSWAQQACHDLGTRAEPAAWEQLTGNLALLRSVHAWCRDHGQTELAVTLSAALHHYAYMRDDHEMLGWAGKALQLPGAHEHPLRPVLQASEAARLIQQSEWRQARELIEAALADVSPGQAAAVIPFTVAGDIDLYHGQFAAAIEHYRMAWQAALAHGDCWGQVEAAGSAAMACAGQGLHDEAAVWLERCLETLKHDPAPTQRAGVLYYLGECAGLRDPAAAGAYLRRSHEMAVGIGAGFLVGASMTRLTAFCTKAMPLPDSLGIFESALAQWQATGNRAELWLTLFRLIPLLREHGEAATAAAVHAAVLQSGELPAFHLADADPAGSEGADRLLAVQWAGADLPEVIEMARAAIGRLHARHA